MRKRFRYILSFMTGAFLSSVILWTGSAFGDPTVTLDLPVHFTTAEGSDVVLEPGVYVVEAAQDWLKITPREGKAVDVLLLETQSATHEESLTEPLAVSVKGETPDTHHIALLWPDGKRLEAIGTYSGIRSRGAISLLTIQRLKRLSRASQSSTPTEFSTPSFGGSGGNRSYDLDCGNQSVLVGAIYKSGMWLDALGIICQEVNPQTGALGNEFTKGTVGGSGGTARVARCNSGRVAQGITGYSGQFVNRIVFFCSPWDSSRKAPVFTPNFNCLGDQALGICVGFGQTSGIKTADFFCPSGKVGKAFRGKHGIYIDSTQFVCDFWNK